VLEAVHIASNKNTVPGDVSAMVPGGIRMGKNHFLSFFLFRMRMEFFLISSAIAIFQVLLLSLPEALSKKTLPK